MSTTYTLDTSTSRAHPTPSPMKRLTVPRIQATKGNEMKGVNRVVYDYNRVVYDYTSKPSGTIEWERAGVPGSFNAATARDLFRVGFH
jgi:GMP synthase PP-ATPase subunit